MDDMGAWTHTLTLCVGSGRARRTWSRRQLRGAGQGAGRGDLAYTLAHRHYDGRGGILSIRRRQVLPGGLAIDLSAPDEMTGGSSRGPVGSPGLACQHPGLHERGPQPFRVFKHVPDPTQSFGSRHVFRPIVGEKRFVGFNPR